MAACSTRRGCHGLAGSRYARVGGGRLAPAIGLKSAAPVADKRSIRMEWDRRVLHPLSGLIPLVTSHEECPGTCRGVFVLVG